jgi:hypothetical protein
MSEKQDPLDPRAISKQLEIEPEAYVPLAARRRGLSPGQRLLLALLLLAVVIGAGMVCLLATGRLWIYG